MTRQEPSGESIPRWPIAFLDGLGNITRDIEPGIATSLGKIVNRETVDLEEAQTWTGDLHAAALRIQAGLDKILQHVKIAKFEQDFIGAVLSLEGGEVHMEDLEEVYDLSDPVKQLTFTAGLLRMVDRGILSHEPVTPWYAVAKDFIPLAEPPDATEDLADQAPDAEAATELSPLELDLLDRATTLGLKASELREDIPAISAMSPEQYRAFRDRLPQTRKRLLASVAASGLVAEWVATGNTKARRYYLEIERAPETPAPPDELAAHAANARVADKLERRRGKRLSAQFAAVLAEGITRTLEASPSSGWPVSEMAKRIVYHFGPEISQAAAIDPH